VYYGHIGDSRIYIVVNHRITQLTKDHSYVQTLVDSGEISREQAESHPRKNEITNALGISSMQPPTLCSEPIEPEAGNCFVLCSDGLSGMVDDRHIEHIVSKHEINIQQRAEHLVQMANAAGGKDNITVQLVEFAVSSKGKVPGRHLNKKLFIAAGLSMAVILAALLAGYSIFFGQNSADKDASAETAHPQPSVQDDASPETKDENVPAFIPQLPEPAPAPDPQPEQKPPPQAPVKSVQDINPSGEAPQDGADRAAPSTKTGEEIKTGEQDKKGAD
jgi:protein phosphatase